MPPNPLKYIEIAGILREEIRKRRLSGTLPGVKRLARRFNCNAKTVQRATDLLVAEGLLHRPNARRTYVQAHGPRPDELEAHSRPETIHVYNCYWGSGQPTSPYLAAVYQGIRAAARRHRVTAVVESGVDPAHEYAHPKQVRRYIESLPPQAWLILPGSAAEAEVCRAIEAARIHAVFVDPPMRSLQPCNTVMTGWHQGIVQLMQTLRMFGHKRIALVSRPWSGGIIRRAVEEGFQAAIEQLELAADECPFLLASTDIPMQEVLNRLLASPRRPTALMNRAAAYQTIRAAARTCGLRIPHHLSVVMLGVSTVLATSPRIARLCCDVQMLGRIAVDTLFQTAHMPANVHVQVRMHLRRGDSIRRPAEP